jgi:hypothetical protein
MASSANHAVLIPLGFTAATWLVPMSLASSVAKVQQPTTRGLASCARGQGRRATGRSFEEVADRLKLAVLTS